MRCDEMSVSIIGETSRREYLTRCSPVSKYHNNIIIMREVFALGR